jgi:hypothetical protein
MGAIVRHGMTKESKTLELLGPIYTDVLQQSHLLLNGIPLKIQLIPHSDAFRVMAHDTTKTYKLVPDEIKMLVCYVDVKPAVYNDIIRKLNNDTLKYNYMRKEMYPFTVNKGESRASLNDIFQGRIPNRVTIGLVSTEAFMGNFQKNPFNFQTYKLKALEISVNGKHIPSEQGLQMDFTNDQMVEAYDSLFTGMGKHLIDSSVGINRYQYSNGYALYCFSIDPALVGYTQQPTKKNGNFKIDLRFSESLTENITVLVQGEFPQTIEVDKSRNVYYI